MFVDTSRALAPELSSRARKEVVSSRLHMIIPVRCRRNAFLASHSEGYMATLQIETWIRQHHGQYRLRLQRTPYFILKNLLLLDPMRCRRGTAAPYLHWEEQHQTIPGKQDTSKRRRKKKKDVLDFRVLSMISTDFVLPHLQFHHRNLPVSRKKIVTFLPVGRKSTWYLLPRLSPGAPPHLYLALLLLLPPST